MNKVTPLTEGTVCKGGQNPPLISTKRPKPPKGSGRRERMMVDLPEVYQMAIRLKALKEGVSIASVVTEIISAALSEEVEEAKRFIVARTKS